VNQIPLRRKSLAVFVIFLFILSAHLVGVQGNYFSGYTFGVQVGDFKRYQVTLLNLLQANGTLRHGMIYYPYFNYTTRIYQGEALLATITNLSNGFLTYQLTLTRKNGLNISSYIIDYNRPSDILMPLFYQFITTTNITLIQEMITVRYRDQASLDVSNDLITLRTEWGTYNGSKFLFESSYNRTSGWATQLYYKTWNKTHTYVEYQIDEATQTTNGTPWLSFPVLSLSLLFLTIFYHKKGRFLTKFLRTLK
jgi:hypothetical protein